MVVAERASWIYALCSHDGALYDGGRYAQVWRTQDGELVNWRDNWVRALCSHAGVFYDGGDYGVWQTGTSREMGSRPGACYGFAAVGDVLLDFGEYGVCDTLMGAPVAQRPASVLAMATLGGAIYDGGAGGVYETHSGETVAQRASPVMSLGVHDGVLYDATGHFQLHATLEDPQGDSPLVELDAPIHAMLSLPAVLFDAVPSSGSG